MALRHASLLLALAAPILLCGCASNRIRASQQQWLHLTYISDPPGAMLYEGEKAWGRAPFTLFYPGSVAAFRAGKCFTPNPVRMRWVSGAEVSVSDVTACPQNGTQQQYVLARPKDVPGLEGDAQFAAAYEQAQTRQAAADVAQRQVATNAAAQEKVAQRREEIWEWILAFGMAGAASASQAQAAPAPYVHCTSHTVGQGQYSHVETDCN